jgi:uncharacterized protein involved in outer membrane biogenesis
VEANEGLETPKRAARSFPRRLALWLGLPLTLLLALLILGIPIPLGPFRGEIESRASDALGRNIRFGELQLVLGIRPRLAIEDLRLAHVVAGRPDVLAVENLDLELSLLELIGRRLHVRRAAVEGVAVRIDPEALPKREARATPADETEPKASSASPWTVDVDYLSLLRVEVEVHRPGAEPTRASLDGLAGSLLWDESVDLAFSGRYQELPIAARIEGASVAELLAGAEAWPLRLAIDMAANHVEFEALLAMGGGVYRIGDIQGRAGATSVSGWLAFEGFATRPRASGRIQLGAVEVELPERSEAQPDPTSTATEPEAAERAPTETDLLTGLLSGRPQPTDEGPGPIAAFLQLLHDFETDLELGVERVSGIGPTVEDLSVALRVSGGELRFPVAMTIAEIPLTGTLRIDEAQELPHLLFQLGAEHFRVDALASVLAPNARIKGPFEELRLELEGRGESLRAFLTTLRIDLRAADAALTYGAERPVAFGVELLELTLSERDSLALRVRGDLLGEAVSLELSGQSVESLLGEQPWALRLEAQGAGATLELSGQAIGFLAEAQLLSTLRIHGERLSSLEPWIGVLPIPDAPYSIRARIDDIPELMRVELDEVRLGQTKLAGDLGWQRSQEEPLLWANLRIESLDVSPYLEAARREPAPDAAAAPAEGEGGIGFDVPILPGGLRIPNADFDLSVGRLVAGDLEVGDLRFRGSLREGFLPTSAFGFRLGDAAFAGATSVDLREPPHTAKFEFGTRAVDVGRLLAHLGVAEGVDARAGALRVELSGEGTTLGDLLQRGDLMARLEDVRWTLRDANSDTGIDLVLDRGELTSPTGDEPTRLVAQGSLDGTPVQLSMQTEQLSFFETPTERLPLELRLEMAGATLVVASQVLLPIERRELEVRMTLEGESLEHASGLFDYELPPLGPYRLTTDLRLTPSDYRLEDMELHVGESRLRGSGRLDTRGVRPRVDLALTSDRVQLDDFAAAVDAVLEKQAETQAEVQSEATELASAASSRDAPSVEELREFLSPEGLLGFDGRLEVQVREVVSGEDELGRGRLVATLEDGRLAMDPLHLELPGGPFDLRMEYAYAGQDVAARIRAHTEQFDYGPLARRADPETDMTGWLSLDLDVEGKAPEIARLLAHANGHLDFLAAPENIQTDVFDLWAVSLLKFILPRLDPGPRSTLNCVVARFDLENGVMDERALLVDTTEMVVRGDATVDFGQEHIRARLTPAPKKAEFLSLQTRVDVNGSFDDFGIGVSPQELVATVLRFVTSIVVVPIQRLFGAPLPADGERTCLEAWRKGKE